MYVYIYIYILYIYIYSTRVVAAVTGSIAREISRRRRGRRRRRAGAWRGARARYTPNLQPEIIPAKIRWLKTSG